MKKTRVTILLTIAFLAVLLTACTGGVSESWPGVTVDGDTVYLSYTTQIYQLNMANCTPAGCVEQWRFPAEPNNKINYYAPVAASEDGSQLFVGSYNHVFYGIPSGGTEAKWSFAEAKDRYISKALVIGDQIYVGSADGTLYSMGLDGSPRWQFATEHAIWGAPATDEKVLYVASMDHHIYKIDPKSGQQIWVTPDLGGQLVAKPALSSKGMLYIGAFGSKTKTDNPDRSSQLVAVNASNGQVAWSKPTKGWVWATPLLKEDVLYFGDTEGYIYAFNTSDGKEIWSRQLDTEANRAIIGAPVIMGDRLYFGSKAGLLYIVNVSDGQPAIASPVQIGGQIMADLVATGDKILIAPTGLETALLMAVNTDGITQWSFLPQKKK
jgi:outer membrane protein assembly factor BamB